MTPLFYSNGILYRLLFHSAVSSHTQTVQTIGEPLRTADLAHTSLKKEKQTIDLLASIWSPHIEHVSGYELS